MSNSESTMGRRDSHQESRRPFGRFRSLRAELSILIVIATVLAFLLAWLLDLLGLTGWYALPITIVTVLIFTYVTSRGLTRPLSQMINAAESMAEGDYTARIHLDKRSRDEVGVLADTFNTMAEELEHADQMRREMIANVSHELRTPVSALQAMVENMADGIVEPTPENLENILSQTHRLSNLISFLLDLSRMEAGAASLEVVPLNMAMFISDLIEPLEYADAGHGHTIEQQIPDDLTLKGDEARLHQLFTNIIANALKHSPDHTSILIEAHADDTHESVVVNVINFGSHIPKEVRNEIFRRFVKNISGPGTESGGTGLGLSIARWAAQLHGGSVQVVDDPRGVNFEIVLPRYPEITQDEEN